MSIQSTGELRDFRLHVAKGHIDAVSLDRDSAKRVVLDIWQHEAEGTLSPARRAELLSSDTVRKLSGRLRRGGRESLEHALTQSRHTPGSVPTVEIWLQTYDRIFHPSSGPRRRGISTEEVSVRGEGGAAVPPSGGIGHFGLG